MSFEQTTPLPLKEFSPKNFPKMAKIGKIWVLTIFKDSKLWTLADVDTGVYQALIVRIDLPPKKFPKR